MASLPLPTAGYVDLELDRFERVMSGDHLALVRVAGRWHLDGAVAPPTPILIADDGRRTERFAPLPQPATSIEWIHADARLWWAGYAVPAELIYACADWALEGPGGETFELPEPQERALLERAEPAGVVVRNGRPYMLMVSGLMAAALVPLALPAIAAADGSGDATVPDTTPPGGTPVASTIPPGSTVAPDGTVLGPDGQPLVPQPDPSQAAGLPPSQPAAPPQQPAPPADPAPPTSTPDPAAAAPPQPTAAVEPAPKAAKPAKRKPQPKPDGYEPDPAPASKPREKHNATRPEPVHGTPSAPAPRTAAPAPAVTPTGSTPLGPVAPAHRTAVPNKVLDGFAIPPFLLPIYQAAGMEYDVPWEVLASINEVETNYGRNLNISSAGALGWMQFMAPTWSLYGVDANLDGRKDPFNPADAIFSAARYLHAAGASENLPRAVFAYNHADWYVADVLARAARLRRLPTDVVDALTGLTQARFPVPGKVRYEHGDTPQADGGTGHWQRASTQSGGHGKLRSATIEAKPGRPAVAVADGRVVAVGESRFGGWIVLEDAYGNRFTYGHLGQVMRRYATPKSRLVTDEQARRELHLPTHDPRPAVAATAGHPALRTVATKTETPVRAPAPAPAPKQRLFAHPARANALAAGGRRQLDPEVTESALAAAARSLGLKPSQVVMRSLHRGSRVVAGTVLGRLGGHVTSHRASLVFRVHPAGKGAPAIDPAPLLDGWRLLQTTAVYGPAGSSTLERRSDRVGVGQMLLLGKAAISRRVLEDPRISVYSCGRDDILAGQIDRRVLATLEYLADSGLNPTVTALKCGHSLYTASGNISEHSTGDAVDIAAVNGIPITGHQGPGSITETTIRRLLTLQGAMKPHQIISLMTFPGTDNTLALADHYDHIHVGFHPQAGDATTLGLQMTEVLKPQQWDRLMSRLAALANPRVAPKPSTYALRVPKRALAARG